MNTENLDLALDITKMVAGALMELFLEMLPRTFLFGLLGFVLAIVLVCIGNRKTWFFRQHLVWNILSKLHYPLWILLLTFTGCAVGATSAVESRVDAELGAHLPPVLEANLPTLKAFLVEKLPVLSDDEPILVKEATQQFLQTLYYEPKSDGFFDIKMARCVNWVTQTLGKRVIATTFSAMVAYSVGRTGKTLGLDTETIAFTVNTIKNADMSQVEKTIVQIVMDTIKYPIKAFFNGIYLHILGLFALIMLAFVAEIIIYHMWWKKGSV